MDFPSKEDVKSILAGTFFLDDEPKRRGTIFNGDGDNSEPFTDEEVKAAKEIRDKIIQNQTSTLKTATHKTIYMAGEVCMWDELRWDKPTQNESPTSTAHTEELSTPHKEGYSVEDEELRKKLQWIEMKSYQHNEWQEMLEINKAVRQAIKFLNQLKK